MDKFRIEIPEFCLVALIGGTSSGKTSFAHRFFRKTEVLSSDFFRGMVCDDENSQALAANSPPPRAEQKLQPRVPRVPSRFGQPKPASRDSL